MLRSFLKIATSSSKINCLLSPESLLHNQLRSTVIVKRRTSPRLAKKGEPLKNLKSKNYVYDVVRNTDHEKQPDIEVILTTFVNGLGNRGDKVSIKSEYGYNNLLLPGLAVYPTPENIEKYKSTEVKDVKRYSSPKVPPLIEVLEKMTLSIIMNKDSPWTLRPWHVRASFRKCGIIVPEDALTMPIKPIEGPNLDLEGKIFFVTITINKTEQVKVKCKIHHWSTNVAERLPYVEEFWKIPGEYLFPEDAEVSKTN